MENIKVVNQNWHMQGFTSDSDRRYMYFSFTDSLVKTNYNGTVICQTHIDGGHLGGLDWYDGKIYASYLRDPCPYTFWGDWSAFFVYVFDGNDLALLDKIEIKGCLDMKKQKTGGFNGIDGIAFGKTPNCETSMFVACATDTGEEYTDQLILRVSLEGEILDTYRIPTGNTVFGIQNMDYEEDTGCFWITTYNQSKPYQSKETLFCLSPSLDKVVKKYRFSTPYGFEALGNGEYFCSLQDGENGHRTGTAYKCTEEFFKNEKTEDEINGFVKSKI